MILGLSWQIFALVAAFILAAVAVVDAKGRNWLAWAVLLIALVLLAR